MTLLLRVESRSICAGAVWERRGTAWHCTVTAPILAWMRGRAAADVALELARRRLGWQWLREDGTVCEARPA